MENGRDRFSTAQQLVERMRLEWARLGPQPGADRRSEQPPCAMQLSLYTAIDASRCCDVRQLKELSMI
jgi:hypothetical protein